MARFKCVLFDWGGTLMSEDGPLDVSMGMWPEVRAIDGAREILAALAPTHRLAVATNAVVSDRAMIELALERVSLREYITDIFCFTELGVRKDSPDFWSHVLATVKMRPSEVAMVGDTLEQDVFPPRRHGVFSIWFNDGGRNLANPGSIPSVQRLQDVIPILTRGQETGAK
jgi:FMN phosphatase YigB (HAD superfamily)